MAVLVTAIVGLVVFLSETRPQLGDTVISEPNFAFQPVMLEQQAEHLSFDYAFRREAREKGLARISRKFIRSQSHCTVS